MPSQHVFPVSELSVIDDDPLIDLHVSGHEPLLMTAEEQRAASLVRQALAAIDSFYGQLGPAQRARMAALYQIPATSTQALNAIVQRARAQVLGALTRLAGRSVDLDAVRIHTARAQGADISEPLWQWLARGTPIQLAPPRLTQDANAFVEHSWLTLAGQALARDDGQPLTIDDVISLGRELDIGATIGQQCDAWTARDDVRSTLRREADARFELALLNAMKAGHVSAQQYQQICAVAGLSLPDALSHGFTQAQSGAALHFLLRIEGHELPAVVIQTGGQTCLVADTYPEARLFMADADRDLTALQVFGEAFRADLWNTRAQREGWAWALLSPAAQQAVAARLPQPLPAANHYPPTVHWVPGAGAYVSRADYDRQASDVRFTAPYPLLRQSVALAWAQAHTQLMVRRIKQRFTPNADSSLAHAQRIGAQWLTTVLDVILIAVPGEVRFPGRGLLFKALFAKQLAVDLPLNLVQAKWAQVGETLVDFFETVLEMQAFRKAGKLHRSQLERVAGILTPVGGHGPVPDVPMNAAQHLRLLLPASLRHLDDALLDTLLQRASVDTPALIAMHQGKADMDMTLVAALSEARNRYWVEHAPALLASDDYTRLPESVEWAVLACLSDALHLRISVSDSLGMPLREFVGGEGERSTVMLVRHAGWTYRTGSGPVTDALADSLFVKIHRQRHPDSPAAEHSRLARDLRITSAEQLATGQGPYHLARALHHGPRPRGSVPVDEGRYLAATVAGASEVPPGGLRGADARAVSFECEQRVPRPGSLANLGKARHQADLAALAGTAGKAGPQTLTHTAQALYC
ncbi:hypothetical protein, partial [Pseudomonas sp.]|uniref:hypothetical protein n=1 Tax=Pseudomonas sp. TaxID=306 RepID=UPI0028A8CDDA